MVKLLNPLDWTGLRVAAVAAAAAAAAAAAEDDDEDDDAAAMEPDETLVGWTLADGRACPTRPKVRISDREMVLPEAPVAFSGSRNCSRSFLFLEAVSDAVNPPCTGCCAADEWREADGMVAGRWVASMLVDHWNKSELSDALSLDESGLGEAGAMQLGVLAGRGPRDPEDPPAPLVPALDKLPIEETRRGILLAD